MNTYIPHKHYKNFWKKRLYAGAYGRITDWRFISFIIKTYPEIQTPSRQYLNPHLIRKPNVLPTK